MTVAENIKRIRKEKKISQKELAKKTGVSVNSIQGYEHGEFRPKTETLQKIAFALSVDPSEIDETLNKPRGYSTPTDFLASWFSCGSDSPTNEDHLRAIVAQLNDDGIDKVIEYASDLAGNTAYNKMIPIKNVKVTHETPES